VSISGTAAVGSDLVGTPALTDVDGLGAFSYQWLRGGVVIAGATAATYRVQSADVGATLAVRVSYTDGGGSSESISSAPTAAVPPTANLINGTVGEDRLRGTSGADSMVGLAGNDVLYGGADNDTLDGGPGLDVASYVGMSQAINASLLTGLVTQGSDTDTLIGIEALFGSEGADTMRGADGPANASGETFRGGEGNDTIDGGTGVDTAEYTGALAGYNVSRSGSVITVEDTNPGNGADGRDQLSNIERLIFADKLLAFGTRAEDVARVAFVLWTPGIKNSADLFGFGLAFYDRNASTFQELCNAALTYWTGVVGNQAFAQHITKWVPQGTPTKSQAELVAIMAAAPDEWTGRIRALEAMAFDSATTAAIDASGIRTTGLVGDLTYPGFGTLFGLLPGG
jgi:hypothetical protein